MEEGSYVELDQPIYELETDKITQEGLADASGTIKFLAQEGDEVEIGATIATIDESADSPSGSANESTKEEDTDTTTTSEETVPEPKEEVAEAAPREEQKSPTPALASQSKSADQTATYSPAVRKLLEETGIDPSSLKGTGKDGRLTKADVLKVQNQEKAETAPQKVASTPSPAPASKASSDDRSPVVRLPPFVGRLLPLGRGTTDLLFFPLSMKWIYLQ